MLGVLNRLEPSESPTNVGTQLRDDAIKYVRDGLPVMEDGEEIRPGKWSCWEDVHLLIEEHEDHSAAMEGMEAYSAAPYDDRSPPDLAPGWGVGAEGNEDDEINDAEAGDDTDAEESEGDEDDSNRSSPDTDSTGDGEHNGVDREGDDVRVDLLGSSDLAVETPAALAGSVVAAPSQVVSATAITDDDEKKKLMTDLLKIMMRENDDTVVRSLQKGLMKTEMEKEQRIKPTIRYDLLQNRVHAEEEETAKRHRRAAWCGNECYELPCNGCGMRFCEACERDGRRIGRDCMCGMPPAPPGLAIQIGGIDNEWSLTSGANWKAGKATASEEERMIQALTDESFTKVCVDSGAGNTR